MPQGNIHITKNAGELRGCDLTTTAGWQKALLLPDDYRVLEVRSTHQCVDIWVVIVESDQIPAVEGRVLPEIVPIYRKDAGMHPALERIETRLWDGNGWRALDEVA